MAANSLQAVADEAVRLAAAPINPRALTSTLIQGLSRGDPEQWASLRDEAAFTTILAAVEQSVQRALRTAAREDERQLLLPGFKRLERLVKVGEVYLATGKLVLPEYRALIRECETRIAGYQHARRSSQAEKRDKELLRELHKFEPIFTRFWATEPDVSLERAQELNEKHLREVAAHHTPGKKPIR